MLFVFLATIYVNCAILKCNYIYVNDELNGNYSPKLWQKKKEFCDRFSFSLIFRTFKVIVNLYNENENVLFIIKCVFFELFYPFFDGKTH